MKSPIKIFLTAVILCTYCCTPKVDGSLSKISIVYDFTFAELAIKYLETGNPEYLQEITNLEAAEHLINHALSAGYNVSKVEFITNLLSPIEEQKKLLPIFKRNLNFAKEDLAKSGIIEKNTSQFLPADCVFSSTLFFTFGYNHVAYDNNCSINLADTVYLNKNNMNTMIYLAIHELHHVGFITAKDGYFAPFVGITTYKEMLHLIEYCMQLEGMATYAPLGIIEQENDVNTNKHYIAIRDLEVVEELEKEFFDIYYHFKNEPDHLLTQEDGYKFQIFSDIKGLQYIVGAHMAKTIDENLGREKLIGLISEPPENYIATYLNSKEQ